MPMTRRSFVALGTALAAAPALGAPRELPGVDPGPYRDAVQAIDAFAAQYLGELGAPGLTLAIVDRNTVLHVASLGHADPLTREAVTPDHQFQIGSISKSFVGLALLQLVDEGRLGVNDPIERHLPGLRFQSPTAPITVHHLLTHTAALPDGPLFPADPAFRHRPAGPLGRDFHYCNMGWRAIGHLIEHLDQRSLAQSLEARLLAPLGMTASSAVITFPSAQRLVQSYWPEQTDRPYPVHGPLVVAPRIEETDGAGCVAATPADMARYLRLLLNGGRLPDGRRLVSAAAFAAFSTPHVEAAEFGNDAHYGYGIAVDTFDGHRRLRHTGGMASFASALEVDTDSGFGVFVSVNAMQGVRPRPVAEYALRALRAVRERRALPRRPTARVPRQIDRPERFLGEYLTSHGAAARVVADGEGIAVTQTGPHAAEIRRPLYPVSGADGLFVTRSGGPEDLDPWVFEPGEGEDAPCSAVGWGDTAWVRAGVAQPATVAAPAAWAAYPGHYRSEDPWLGSHRVTLRAGRLWLDGYIPLEPTGDGRFWWRNEPTSPEWVSFGDVLSGRAMTLTISGEPLVRLSERFDPGFTRD